MDTGQQAFIHNLSLFQLFLLGGCLSEGITRLLHPMLQGLHREASSPSAPLSQCCFPALPGLLEPLSQQPRSDIPSDVSWGLPLWCGLPSCSPLDAFPLPPLPFCILVSFCLAVPCLFPGCLSPFLPLIVPHSCSWSQASCRRLMSPRDICFLPLPSVSSQGGLKGYQLQGKFAWSLENLNKNAQQLLVYHWPCSSPKDLMSDCSPHSRLQRNERAGAAERGLASPCLCGWTKHSSLALPLEMTVSETRAKQNNPSPKPDDI